jgi:hypothetical protein
MSDLLIVPSGVLIAPKAYVEKKKYRKPRKRKYRADWQPPVRHSQGGQRFAPLPQPIGR